MFIKKCLIISCLLSFLIACDNDKKVESKKEDQLKQVIDQPIIDDNIVDNIIENKRIKQLNDDYLLFFDQYNNLINKANKYQEQLNNCQNLINQIQQNIDEINENKLNQDQELINNYQLLIKRTKHKQQWFNNNYHGWGYSIIRITLFVINLFLFLTFLITQILGRLNKLDGFNDRMDKYRTENKEVPDDTFFV